MAGKQVFAYDLRQSNPVLSNSVKEFGYNTDEVNQVRITIWYTICVIQIFVFLCLTPGYTLDMSQ